jgi:hypothetical protein
MTPPVRTAATARRRERRASDTIEKDIKRLRNRVKSRAIIAQIRRVALRAPAAAA